MKQHQPGMPESVSPLGEILLQRGLITPSQFAVAMKLKRRTGSRLGDVLVSEGMVGLKDLYQALADHYQLPFFNLLESPPAAALCSVSDIDFYLRLGFIPYARRGGVTVLACCEVSEELIRWARTRYGAQFALAITSPLDIHRSVEQLFSRSIEETSRTRLWQGQPEHSARITIDPRQGCVAALIILSGILAFWFAPHHTASLFLLGCNVLYAISMLFKWRLVVLGRPMFERIHTVGRATPLLSDHQLPVYTILLPLYREAESLPNLLASLERIDYPKSKLDIKLILEQDDDVTYQAAIALKPSYRYEIIRVPYSLPKTKPKACNYALRFARGDYVCIYDAEDHPSRRQLKRAVAAFHAARPDVICLQARLNYFNADENWLTRQFTLEYTILFDYMLPGLQAMDMPIPLGGTSNHIALAKLRELGEWDPYNVTEDADIGIRLARAGYRTEMFDSYTLEESPIHLGAWMKQRTRWIKGYMQTWLVHMRQPVRLLKRLGWRGFLGFQVFVGLSCFTFLSAPLLWALCLLWLFEGLPLELHFAGLIYPLAAANIALQLGVHWYMGLLAARRHRTTLRRKLARAAVWYPLYPLLHTLASYRALWQLCFRPHLWEKTSHGLTATRPPNQA